MKSIIEKEVEDKIESCFIIFLFITFTLMLINLTFGVNYSGDKLNTLGLICLIILIIIAVLSMIISSYYFKNNKTNLEGKER